MTHAAHADPADLLETALAGEVAETMHALSTPSRLRILARLYVARSSVSNLAHTLGMEPSAVSHQLRILRHLGLVTGHREGRLMVYGLHDEHVGQMLAEAMSHVDHLRSCVAGHNHHSATALAV